MSAVHESHKEIVVAEDCGHLVHIITDAIKVGLRQRSVDEHKEAYLILADVLGLNVLDANEARCGEACRADTIDSFQHFSAHLGGVFKLVGSDIL